MNRYLKESIIFVLQLFMFYIFPMFAGPTDAMGMVFLILLATLLLSFILGILSGNRIKFLYPVATSLVFLPTIFIYYNESALVHALWYLVLAVAGLLVGTGLRCLFRLIFRKK